MSITLSPLTQTNIYFSANHAPKNKYEKNCATKEPQKKNFHLPQRS